jgi:abortive infection bacteriophage resistance protein
MGSFNYNKPPLNPDQQVQRLLNKGLVVSDTAAAAEYLALTNYIRFAEYARHTVGEDDAYIVGTQFDSIRRLIEFDSTLRNILIQAIERIEIAYRTALCLDASLRTGDPFWYLNRSNFKNQEQLEESLGILKAELAKASAPHRSLVRFYKDTYGDDYPPAWALLEVATFTFWSYICQNLADPAIKNAVADRLGCLPKHLHGWIASMVALRNKCAHHSRVWNSEISSQPGSTREMKALGAKKVYLLILVIQEFLSKIGGKRIFDERLAQLFDDYPDVDQSSMGYP